jgi:hypothetical protein
MAGTSLACPGHDKARVSIEVERALSESWLSECGAESGLSSVNDIGG